MRIRSVIMLCVSLALGFGAAACGGDDGDGGGDGLPACPTGGTDLTYDNFGKSFFDTHCTSCHAAGSGVSVAQDNPFETQAQIQAEADEIYERAGGTNTNMPPDGGPTADDRLKLEEWLSCGAK